MNNTDLIAHHYRTLKIDPPCTWSQLKQQYRKQANIWHPDRLQNDPNMLATANDKLKEINLAYTFFSDYFKKHNTLPLTEKSEKIMADNSSVSVNADDSVTDDSYDSFVETVNNDCQENRTRRRVITILSLLAVGFLSLKYIQHTDSDNEEISSQHYQEIPRDSLASKPLIQSRSPIQIQKHFSYGSTLGQVHAAQGTPTRTDDDIWFYGESEVHFKNGRVVSWENKTENPLHVFTDTLNINRTNFFVIGATKKRVLFIQGKPTHQSVDTWDYGLSRVYFFDSKVVNWYNSPLDPLKARK